MRKVKRRSSTVPRSTIFSELWQVRRVAVGEVPQTTARILSTVLVLLTKKRPELLETNQRVGRESIANSKGAGLCAYISRSTTMPRRNQSRLLGTKRLFGWVLLLAACAPFSAWAGSSVVSGCVRLRDASNFVARRVYIDNWCGKTVTLAFCGRPQGNYSMEYKRVTVTPLPKGVQESGVGVDFRPQTRFVWRWCYGLACAYPKQCE